MSTTENIYKPAKSVLLEQWAAERQELIELCRNLKPEEWETPSLCEGWRVRDVVAHLIGLQTERYLPPKRARIKRQDISLEELLAQLEQTTHLQPNWLMRWWPGSYLYEDWVHQQDIRWVLGPDRQHQQNPTRLLLLLNKLVKTAQKKGRTFIASDLEWQAGEGQEVRGPAEVLIMALANRPVALGRLSGPGLSQLLPS